MKDLRYFTAFVVTVAVVVAVLWLRPAPASVSMIPEESQMRSQVVVPGTPGGYGTVGPGGVCLPYGAWCRGLATESKAPPVDRQHAFIGPPATIIVSGTATEYLAVRGHWVSWVTAEVRLTSDPEKDQCYITRKGKEGEEVDVPALWCDEAGLR